MVRNVTKKELRNFNIKASISGNADSLIKSYSRKMDNAIFLSHSSKDKDLVLSIIKILENHGSSVYIDEIDPEMPVSTNEKTASLLKERIKDCKRFVLLTTENSKDSKWVPWELGIADGFKGISKMAIFPASEHESVDNWSEWEYLGIYRKIVFGKLHGHNGDVLMVLDKKTNTATELSAWLSGY